MRVGLVDGRRNISFASFSFGLSDEAGMILEQENIIQDGEGLSSSIDNIDIKLSLLNIYDCCSEDNWDGDGAKAITPASWRGAVKILKSLPRGFPKPEITTSPLGFIVIEWYKKKGHILTVTIETEGILSYNALLGKNNESYGIATFEQDLPDLIMYNLNTLFGN